jgi:CBS domain-containing protein
MKTIGDLLKVKGRQVWSIGASASVFEALQLMAEKDIGALAVVEGDRLVGIFSERDYARKIILLGRSSSTTAVSDVMTSRVAVLDPARTIEEAMALMTDKRLRHLPVMVGGELAGMISIGDLVKEIISEREFVIAQLENYIYGQQSGS